MVNLIKNYVPLRLTLPPIDTSTQLSTDDDTLPCDTFLYIKKHVSSQSSNTGSESRTLFIANAPFYPYVRTSILLTALFEKYGDVEEVVVAPNPRKDLLEQNTGGAVDEESVLQTMFEKGIRDESGDSGYYGMALDEDTWYRQGRFAHVRFTDGKQMRNAMAVLTGEQKSKKKSKKKGAGDPGHVRFKKLELQELQDVSIARFHKENARFGVIDNNTIDDDAGSGSENNEGHVPPPKGIKALIQLHQNRIPPRALLQRITDNIMIQYEQSETLAKQTRQTAVEGVPDEDGFVTVSYKAAVGDRVAMERNGTLGKVGDEGKKRGKRHREASKRARSSNGEGDNKLSKGSDELKDFYRFQLRENKKRGMEELKTRFEEDLKRVKRMKEEKMYRPF